MLSIWEKRTDKLSFILLGGIRSSWHKEIWSLSQTIKALHSNRGSAHLGDGAVSGDWDGDDSLEGSAVSAGGLWGVDGGALVLDVGDVAVEGVGVVGDDLDAAVGKVDPVLALNVAAGILGLCLVEVGAGVSVLHAVLVGEGLGRKNLLNSSIGGPGGRSVALGLGQSNGGNSAENDDLEYHSRLAGSYVKPKAQH